MLNNNNIYQELKNELENVKNNETLQQYLSQATIMVVSVTASTTQVNSGVNIMQITVVVGRG